VVLRGVCAVLFGLGAFVRRGITLAALVILYGAYALADGVPAVGAAMAGRRSGALPWGELLAGLAAIAAAVVTFRWPGPGSVVRVDLGESVPGVGRDRKTGGQ
jgi:uncharacterized membrane protein HdeD (DUF308 family)